MSHLPPVEPECNLGWPREYKGHVHRSFHAHCCEILMSAASSMSSTHEVSAHRVRFTGLERDLTYGVGPKNPPRRHHDFLGEQALLLDALRSQTTLVSQGGDMTRQHRRATTMRRTFSNSKDVRLAIQLITFSGLMLFLTGLVAETVLLR